MPNMQPPIAINKAIENVLKCDRGRLLAGLVARLGEFQAAEDALQEALISAMKHWARNGLPASPVGWLMRVALNKGIDRVRAKGRETKKVDQLMHLTATQTHPIDQEPIPDERLRLIFSCCHPSLEEKTRVALTLRSVCQLTTQEIAAAFLDNDVAIGQRISRAKAKIKASGISFSIPEPEMWPARLASVLSTVYVIFTTGYVLEDESPRDLCAEALFLARLLDRLHPADPEIEGALALMLLTHARQKARVGDDGAILPPENQDRTKWDDRCITEGQALLANAIARQKPGPFQIKAAIADCHMGAEGPDWPQIAALYQSLFRFEPTPVVALNAAVALAEIGYEKDALKQIEALQIDLQKFQPWYAAYAAVLAKLKEFSKAKDAYAQAIHMAPNEPSKRFLEKKLKALA